MDQHRKLECRAEESLLKKLQISKFEFGYKCFKPKRTMINLVGLKRETPGSRSRTRTHDPQILGSGYIIGKKQ